MNRYRADGEDRLWFTDNEIERIMEDELRKAKLLPTRESSVVDTTVGVLLCATCEAKVPS